MCLSVCVCVHVCTHTHIRMCTLYPHRPESHQELMEQVGEAGVGRQSLFLVCVELHVKEKVTSYFCHPAEEHFSFYVFAFQ